MAETLDLSTPSASVGRYRFDFAVALFAANEAAHLEACLLAVAAAVAGRSCSLDVVLNGTRDDSIARLRTLKLPQISLRVWEIELGDKANAMNAYLHDIRPPAALYVMMDAYTRIEPGALLSLETAVAANPEASIASGVPRNGRSAVSYAAHVLRGGAINGNLYALTPAFVERVCALNYRLPLGLYRTDPLLGSMAAHEFDPMTTDWNSSRLLGVERAGYRITPLSLFRLSDVKRQFRREINQARGILENEAIKDIIYEAGYGALPRYADEMVRAHVAKRKSWTGTRRQRVFLPFVMRGLGHSRALSATAEETTPRLVLLRTKGP